MEKLYCKKYTGIGRVLETGYTEAEGTSPSFYQPDNKTGYCTGQWITVEVLHGVMHSRYHPGDVAEKIWSYGGDTGIVGKPAAGDIVGFHYGYYAIIWEKLSKKELKKVIKEGLVPAPPAS